MNAAGELEERSGDGGLRRHQHGGGRGKSERPNGAESKIGGGTGSPVVHSLHALREFADEKATEDETQSPGDERRQHGEESDESNGTATRFGDACEFADR